MTNRTVQIQGYGYNSTPAEITVTLDGNTIFNGAIPTLNEPVPSFDTLFPVVTICSFEIPVDFSGNIPMTCTVNSGEVVFAEILGNYTLMSNPVFSEAELAVLISPSSTRVEKIAIYSAHATPAFSPAEIAVLESPTSTSGEINAILTAHGVLPFISSGPDTYLDLNGSPDVRVNVVIDDVPQNPDHTTGNEGTFWWLINPGSILAYDLNVTAGAV